MKGVANGLQNRECQFDSDSGVKLSKTKIEYIMNDAFICPECNGRGKVFDHLAGVFTLGLNYLFGRETCHRCGGRGYIKIR